MVDEAILEGKKILIVDDEPDILETLEEMLDMCLVDKAPSYETAKKFIKKTIYDAAILDIMGVRGYDLLELCREKDIPALMLTAHALNPESLVKSVRKGAKSYVPKDKIAEISMYLADILRNREEGIEKHARWFSQLKPFFDKRFGPHWRERNPEFWTEFDKNFRVSKKEIEKMMH